MLDGWGRTTRGRALRKSGSDRVELEQQVRMFSGVINDMKARQSGRGHCQLIADYEQIVAELKEALAMVAPSRLH
jgi:hypothetical protein